MSTFTFHYAQPDSYHFCQDSVLAPKLIAEDLRKSGAHPRFALDVCAGCGVMGFELLHALGSESSIERFDFLEIQNEFRAFFDLNVEATGFRKTRWLQENYEVLAGAAYADAYDLIIANPPYFKTGEGTPSPNQLNTRARFFVDSNLETLLMGIRNALTPNGRAYLLMKSGKEHGRDAFTSARLQLYPFTVEQLAEVRGTLLVRIVKETISSDPSRVD